MIVVMVVMMAVVVAMIMPMVVMVMMVDVVVHRILFPPVGGLLLAGLLGTEHRRGLLHLRALRRQEYAVLDRI